MDARERGARSLILVRNRLARLVGLCARRLLAAQSRVEHRRVSPLERKIQRWCGPLLTSRRPRWAGLAVTTVILVASLGYGVIRGEHIDEIVSALKDARDATANAAGFRIASIALAGNKQVSREEILAIAGVTGRTSLLFLDVEVARTRLRANPWIADATVLKLYPDRLQVGITERHAFALWQKDGRISVIAQDGTVLEPYANRFTGLPLVVGKGAEKAADAFLAALGRVPALRDQVRAAVLVAERRWDLHLRNGIEIQLPETDPEQALAQLVSLDRDKKLLSRDITIVDLRLSDRVIVRQSDASAQARAAALKEREKAKKKGGAA